MYAKQRNAGSKRDFIDHKNPRSSRKKIIPVPRREGSRRKIEKNPSQRNLKKKPSMGYLERYNSRNSKRSTSSKRQGSYDSNISFKRRSGYRSRSIGQTSKKSTSRSKKSSKKLNPVRPPSRRRINDKPSASKYGGGQRRKSRDRVMSNYNSVKGGQSKPSRVSSRHEKYART